jgi:hypothetical protein
MKLNKQPMEILKERGEGKGNRIVPGQFKDATQRRERDAPWNSKPSRRKKHREMVAAAGMVVEESRKPFYLLGSVSVLTSSRRTLRPTLSA